MNEDKWTWKINKQEPNGIVDATITSKDGKSKLRLTGVHGKMVDAVTSLLISSYSWGEADALASVSVVEKKAK